MKIVVISAMTDGVMTKLNSHAKRIKRGAGRSAFLENGSATVIQIVSMALMRTLRCTVVPHRRPAQKINLLVRMGAASTKVGCVIMTMIVVMVLTRVKSATLNTKLARLWSLAVRTLSVFASSTDAMGRMIVVIIQMKLDAVSFYETSKISLINCVISEKDNSTCKTPGEFTCNNGQCIDYQLVCNKVPDCADESDEPAHCNVDECAKVEIHQCGHKCVDTPTGFYCECNQGYKYVPLILIY